MINISNLSYRLNNTPILSDISLTIPKQGITALIGPNGAGKSTLLSLISRLEALQSGTVQIDDLNVGTCASDALARKLAILPQRMHVSTRLSVRELVTFGRYPHSKGRLRDADHDKVSQALALFELQDMADRQIDNLSGGQQQRAYLAMTYAQDTDYLLLDEPLNNLDISATRNLMGILQDLSSNHERTIIIVVHDINIASRYADHLVALRDGKLAVEGRPAKVINSDFMRSIYQTNTEIILHNDRPVVIV